MSSLKDEKVFHDEGDGTVEDVDIIPSDLPVHLGEDVAYGPGGIAGVVQSPFVFAAALIASMGGFSFGYDQGVISIINVMDQFHDVFPYATNGFGKGFMTAMLEFGAFIGCFFMPWLADKISRKKAIFVVTIFFNVGAVLQTAAVNYEMLVLGRTIGGIGVGTLAMGAPLYISEISPPNLRGTLLVLESISICLGVVVSFYITYGTRHMDGEIAFRLPLGLQMVSATIVGFGIFFFPYSPRWLALVGRNEDALANLSRMRRLPSDDERVQTEYKGIVAEAQFQKTVLERRHPGKHGLRLEILTWLDLFSPNTWRRTVVGVGVAFFQQFMLLPPRTFSLYQVFSGINAFIYYAPTLFQSLGQSEQIALDMSGVFNILQFVAVCVCFFIIDRVGRRPLAIFGGLGGLVSWGIMAILVGLFSDNWKAHSAAGWGAVAMAFMFILTYGVSYSPLGWALPSEVFPTATRSKGVALSTATVWLCNFIIGLITPPMIENLGFGTYVFFAAWCGLAAVWAFFLVPETKGKTLEQMDEVFGDNSGQEEREIMQATAAQVMRAGVPTHQV